MGRNLIMVLLLALVHTASAWTNGRLLIWMDADRASAMRLVADKFEEDYGIQVQIETPEKITDNFPLAAQAERRRRRGHRLARVRSRCRLCVQRAAAGRPGHFTGLEECAR